MDRVRWMLFIDGENFTARGSDLAPALGVMLADGQYYRPRRFLWLPGLSAKNVSFAPLNAPRLEAAPDRAYYFTGVQGNDQDISDTAGKLRALGFTAKVYQREKGKQCPKRVDIALATTMLSHAFDDAFDVAVLVSGDEDFVPMVEELKRRGKQVYGWFFRAPSAGLSDELYRSFDRMMTMDAPFKEHWGRTPTVLWPPTQTREMSS